MRKTSRIDEIPTYTNLLFMRKENAHFVLVSAFAYTMTFVQEAHQSTTIQF